MRVGDEEAADTEVGAPSVKDDNCTALDAFTILKRQKICSIQRADVQKNGCQDERAGNSG